MCQTFLSKTFANSHNVQKQYEKNVWEKTNEAYSLSIRVYIITKSMRAL